MFGPAGIQAGDGGGVKNTLLQYIKAPQAFGLAIRTQI